MGVRADRSERVEPAEPWLLLLSAALGIVLAVPFARQTLLQPWVALQFGSPRGRSALVYLPHVLVVGFALFVWRISPPLRPVGTAAGSFVLAAVATDALPFLGFTLP